MTAGDRRVLLAGEQASAAEDRAVRLDVRIAEVDVAADDRHAGEAPAAAHAGNPVEAGVMRLMQFRLF